MKCVVNWVPLRICVQPYLKDCYFPNKLFFRASRFYWNCWDGCSRSTVWDRILHLWGTETYSTSQLGGCGPKPYFDFVAWWATVPLPPLSCRQLQEVKTRHYGLKSIYASVGAENL